MPHLSFPFSIQGSRNQKLPVRHGVIAVPEETDRDLLQKAPFPGGVAGSESVVAQEVCALPPTHLCCSHTALGLLSWHRYPCFLLEASLGSPELGAFPWEATFLLYLVGGHVDWVAVPLPSAVGASRRWRWRRGPIGHVSLVGSRRPGP